MIIIKPPPAEQMTNTATPPDTADLTPCQAQFLADLRASLLDMKHGRVQPAREALREIEREIAAEESAPPDR